MDYPPASTPNPSVHSTPGGSSLPFTPQQMAAIGQQLLAGVIQWVVQALVGIVPGGAELQQLLGQLSTWGSELEGGVSGVETAIQQFLAGAGQESMQAFGQLLGALNAGIQSLLANAGQGLDLATLGSAIGAGINDATNAAYQIEDTVENALGAGAAAASSALGAALAGFFGQFAGVVNGGIGSPGPSWEAIAAAQQLAMQQAAQAAQTAAITSQLPRFYGGSGTFGLNAEVSFAGLTSLPSTFTPVSTIAAQSARYNTPASTDQQTVSAIWSATDRFPKYLFLRGNLAMTTYVVAKLWDNDPDTGAGRSEIICSVAGVEQVFTTFALPGNGQIMSNAVYAFEATANEFELTGPNGLNVTYVDGTVGGAPLVSQIGDSYRYGGVGFDGTVLSQTAVMTPGPGAYQIPAGTSQLDVVPLGAGGGGQIGFATTGGAGGGAGSYNPFTLNGDQLAATGGQITYNIGTGGSNPLVGQPLSNADVVFLGVPGSAGGATTVNVPGIGTITAAGGRGGASGGTGTQSGAPGAGPGVLNYLGETYFGGGNAGAGAGGNLPGGGGGGGNFFPPFNWINPVGGPGAPGAVWFTAYTLNWPGSLFSWAFFDSGPSSGPASAFVATAEATTSTTYTSLETTTDQVTINIGPNRMAIIILTCTSSPPNVHYMSFKASGANTIAPNDAQALMHDGVNSTWHQCSYIQLLTAADLPNEGATTFAAQYRSPSAASLTWSNRRIAVIPL